MVIKKTFEFIKRFFKESIQRRALLLFLLLVLLLWLSIEVSQAKRAPDIETSSAVAYNLDYTSAGDSEQTVTKSKKELREEEKEQKRIEKKWQEERKTIEQQRKSDKEKAEAESIENATTTAPTTATTTAPLDNTKPTATTKTSVVAPEPPHQTEPQTPGSPTQSPQTEPATAEPPTPAPTEPPPQIRPNAGNGTFRDDVALKVFELVNLERRTYGLSELKWDSGFSNTGKIRAVEIVDFFSLDHVRPDGRIWNSVLNESGITTWLISGENIARGGNSSYDSDWYTAEMVMENWMNSPGHRANILREEFEYVGVGTYDLDGKRYYVQHFGVYFD